MKAQISTLNNSKSFFGTLEPFKEEQYFFIFSFNPSFYMEWSGSSWLGCESNYQQWVSILVSIWNDLEAAVALQKRNYATVSILVSKWNALEE